MRTALEEDTRPAGSHSITELLSGTDYQHHSMVCAGCSCLCDDVSYYVKDGRVVHTLNLCEVGMKRLRSLGAQALPAPLHKESAEELIARSVDLLTARGTALILGADSLDEAEIAASLRLAAQLKGIWLPWPFMGVHRFYTTALRYGWATALYDEVRDRSDVVMFWHADPLTTHHRHLSRYSFFARGRYTERGHSDRTLVAVARHATMMERLCNQFFVVPPGGDAQFIDTVRTPSLASGCVHRDLPLLVKVLERASYVSLFVDPEQIDDEGLRSLFDWSLSVNAQGRTRFVILPLWAGGADVAGFIQVSLEHGGRPWGYDFSGDSLHRESALGWQVITEKVGSVLVFESGPEGAGRRSVSEKLAGKPTVRITPFEHPGPKGIDMVVAAAMSGIEEDGVFFRADGLPLRARKIEGIASRGYPLVQDILDEMCVGVGS